MLLLPHLLKRKCPPPKKPTEKQPQRKRKKRRVLMKPPNMMKKEKTKEKKRKLKHPKLSNEKPKINKDQHTQNTQLKILILFLLGVFLGTPMKTLFVLTLNHVEILPTHVLSVDLMEEAEVLDTSTFLRQRLAIKQ